MNRDLLLCKGIRKEDNKEVCGYVYEHQPPLQCMVSEDYVPEPSKWYILNTSFADWNMPRQVDFTEIIPESICRCTGQTDKTNTLIYENDKVKVLKTQSIYAVKWSEHFGYWTMCKETNVECFNLTILKAEEIELLEESKKRN